jgi:hypothetical protein
MPLDKEGTTPVQPHDRFRCLSTTGRFHLIRRIAVFLENFRLLLQSQEGS